MTPEIIGNLAGLPVEWTRSQNHPDLPPGGMGVGTAGDWVRWGGGPWWRLDGSGVFRGVFNLRACLMRREWSAAEAVELWCGFARPDLTIKDAEVNNRGLVLIRETLTGQTKAHERYMAWYAARARDYAAGIGVVS